MAPSLLTVGTAALACVGGAAAKQWYLRDSYDASNFFDKFDFADSSTAGHVQYQTKKDAFDLGLVKVDGDEVYVGVDHKTLLQGDGFAGRPSVRIESKAEYNHGLFIARFSHLPESKCGAWPSFWSFGAPWPTGGEIDIYQGGSSQVNKPALRTGNSEELGTCKLDGEGQTSPVGTDNCDNSFENAPLQLANQGCSASDHNGPYGNTDGGVYAVEWTTEFIKLYSWTWNNIPSDVDSEEPNTDSWGAPSVWLKNENCDVDDHFVNQKLVFNIDFCHSRTGGEEAWSQTCKDSTKFDTCVDYVSSKPGEFAGSYFQIQDIRYFKGVKPIGGTPAKVAAVDNAAIADGSETTVGPFPDVVEFAAFNGPIGTGGTQTTISTHGPFTNTTITTATQTTATETTGTETTGTETTGTETTGTETTGTETTGTETTGTETTGTETTGTETTGTETTGTQTTGTETTGTETTGTQTTGTETTGTETTGTETTGTETTGTETTGTQTTGTETTGTETTGTQTTGTETTGTETTGTETTGTETTGTETTGTETTGTETTGTNTETTGTETTGTETTGTETTGTQTTGTETTGTETTGTETTGTETTGTETTGTESTSTGTETETRGGSTLTTTGTETGPITTAPVTTSSVEMTTSTVYTTITETITKCPPGVPCHPGSVTTKTVVLYTTVCPVTATPTGGVETITETITNIYTITACPPEVKDCPYGKVITKYITTTYCPGNPTALVEVTAKPTGGAQTITETITKVYTISACPPEVTDCPYGSITTDYFTTTYCPGEEKTTDVVVTKTVTNGYIPPSAFTPGGCVGEGCPPKTVVVYKTESAKPTGFETVPASGSGAKPTEGSGNTCDGEDCPEVVTAGAAKVGASLVLVLAAVAAMMI
ncbi:Fc.00g098650.m01.CDS01 [Cosmosporella sp. VM-42]